MSSKDLVRKDDSSYEPLVYFINTPADDTTAIDCYSY